MRTGSTVLAAALAAATALPASADRLLTHDGRYITVKKAREIEDGYQLEFDHGTIDCPAEFVQSVEIEGNMDDYVPQNDRERKELEKGKIRYKGRWLSKAAFERELKKEQEESAERTAELAAHSDWYDAWEKETKHFLIKTNTTPELLQYYADLLESFYDMIDDTIRIKASPALRRKKMTVRIYKSQRDFNEFSPGISGGGVLGYFWWVDFSLNFYQDYQEPSLSNWVALHECTHGLTYLIDQQYDSPSWLNEGIADFLGSSKLTTEQKKNGEYEFEIETGQLQTDRILTVTEAMRSGTDTKLKDMIRMHSYSDGFGGFEYAHAWSFIYFLNNSKKQYKTGFEKLFKDVYTIKKGLNYELSSGGNLGGVSKMIPRGEWEEVLLSYLKADSISTLEKEWKEFVGAIEIDGPVAKFKRGQRAVQWGDAFSDEDEAKKALDDLDDAIAGGVDDPRAYAARGRLHAWYNRRGKAIADYRKAMELSPMNPNFRFSLGRELSGYMGMFSPGGGYSIRISSSGSLRNFEIDGDREEAEEAYVHFGLAMELDPQNAGYEVFLDEYADAFSKKFGAAPQARVPGE